MRFRSHNPVFSRINRTEGEFVSTDYEVATYKGVATKTLYYLAVTVLGAFLGIFLLVRNSSALSALLTIGGFGTFIFSLVAMISPRMSKSFGTLYCFFEGLFLGIISLAFESVANGVITAAIVSTFTVVLVVSALFTTGIIKVNSRFMKVLLTLSISIIISQFILLILSWTGVFQYTFGLSFVASLIMIFLASLYLIFDLQNVVNIVEGQMPKEYEWYAAFGLTFTVLWIYMEILPILLEIFASNN